LVSFKLWMNIVCSHNKITRITLNISAHDLRGLLLREGRMGRKGKGGKGKGGKKGEGKREGRKGEGEGRRVGLRHGCWGMDASIYIWLNLPNRGLFQQFLHCHNRKGVKKINKTCVFLTYYFNNVLLKWRHHRVILCRRRLRTVIELVYHFTRQCGQALWCGHFYYDLMPHLSAIKMIIIIIINFIRSWQT